MGTPDGRPHRDRAATVGLGVVAVVAVLAIGGVALGALRPQGSYGIDAFSIKATVSWSTRLLLASATAACCVLAPGLIARCWLPTSSLWRNPALLWVPGFAYLLAAGLLTWGLAAFVSPHLVSAVAVLLVPVALLAALVRRGTVLVPRGAEAAILGVALLLLLIGIGKATWSPGPEGELYGGTISRTLEVGARSDSRIPYNAVMLAAHGNGPYSSVGTSYYSPYLFSDRSPVAGLANVPVVLSQGNEPPVDLPDGPWSPFDAEGFATSRIVLMLLGATVVLGVFGLLHPVLGERRALAAGALVALCPFVVHETYFTWPKLLSASFGLAALTVLALRHPFWAGILLGFGFLAHPSGLLVVPGVCLLWLVLLWRGTPGLGDLSVTPTSDWLRRGSRDIVLLGMGMGAIYLSWRAINLGHLADQFAGYVFAADSARPVPFDRWFASRLSSLGNTVVPFRLIVADATNPAVNSISGPSPGVVRLGISFWSTLPLGVGLVYYPVMLYGLARFARRAPWLFVAAVVVPFTIFWIYWGSAITGLTREGLHFLFVLTVVVAFVGHSVAPGPRGLTVVVRWTSTLRVVGVAFMLVVPTIATTGILGPRPFIVTDVASLTAMAVGVIGLGWCSWRWLAPPWLSRPAGGRPAGRASLGSAAAAAGPTA